MSVPIKRAFLMGDQIYLRPLEMSDIEDEYLQWLNDVELSEFIPSMRFPATQQNVEKYVSEALQDENIVFLAIVEKETGKHVGNIKLGPIRWIDRRAEYGRFIGDPDARSKGVGSEAVRLILRYAFEVLNLYKVTAKCVAPNKAAIRSNEKNGLAVESVLKEHQYLRGRFEDIMVMGITRDTYFRRE